MSFHPPFLGGILYNITGVNTPTVSAGTYVGSTMSAANMYASTITASNVIANTVSSSTFTGANAQLSGTISAATHVGTTMSAANIFANRITASNISILNANSIEFGSGVAGKEANAGKIGYQAFSVNSLDIVGAGNGSPGRLVRIYDDIVVGDKVSAGNIVATTMMSAANMYSSLVSAANIGASNSITTGVINLTNSANGINFAGNFSNKQIALAIPGTDYYGMGASNSAIQYQVGGGAVHRFYNNSSIGSSNAALGTLLLEINSSGVSSSNVQLSGTISAATHVGTTFSAGTMHAATMTAANIGASSTISAATLVGTTMSAANIGGGYISSGSLAMSGHITLPKSKYISSAPGDVFTTNGNTLSHYSLGWYDDPVLSEVGPMCYLSGYGGIRFFGMGLARMSILNNGYVGIGTTSPGYTLDVSGDINFTGNLRQNGSIFSSGTSQWTTTAGNVSYTSGSVVVGTVVSAGTMLVSPNATIANINASTGITAGTIVVSTITAGTVTAANIGAPNISAGTLLSGIINAKAANPQIKVYHTSPGNETSIYYDAGSVNSHWYVGQNVGSVGVGSFAFFNANVGTVMSLLSAGNVGIGTLTPGYKLDVNGIVAGTTFTGSNAQLSGTISAGTHVGTTFSAGTMHADTMTAANIGASNSISTATLYASGNAAIYGTINMGAIVRNQSLAIYNDGTNYFGFGVNDWGIQYNAGESAGVSEHCFYSGSTVNNRGTLRAKINISGISSSNLQLSGTISAATHVGTTFSAGTMHASTMTAANIGAPTISAGTMLVSPNATIANINASTGITAGTIVAATITAGTVTAANIGAPNISVGTMLSATSINASSGITSGNVSLPAGGKFGVQPINDAFTPAAAVGAIGNYSLQWQTDTALGYWVGSLSGWGGLRFYTSSQSMPVMTLPGGASAPQKVGILTTSPNYTLDVNGTVAGTTFTGASAQLSGSVSASNLCVPSSTTISGSFVGAANQSGANVTNLSFSSATIASFIAYVTVTTSSAGETFTLVGTYSVANSTWNTANLDITSSGDTSGVSFSISSTGQITYSSGANIPTFRWYVQQLLK